MKNYLLRERRKGPKVENGGVVKTTSFSKTFKEREFKDFSFYDNPISTLQHLYNYL